MYTTGDLLSQFDWLSTRTLHNWHRYGWVRGTTNGHRYLWPDWTPRMLKLLHNTIGDSHEPAPLQLKLQLISLADLLESQPGTELAFFVGDVAIPSASAETAAEVSKMTGQTVRSFVSIPA